MAKQRQSIPLSQMGPDGAHHRDFMAWCQQVKNVKIDGLEPAHFPGAGIGIVATRDITVGETLVFVPAEALLTVDPDAKRDDSSSEMSVHGRLALLLLERAQSTEAATTVKPWMQAMPKLANMFAGAPLYWDESLRKCLPDKAASIYEKQRTNHDKDAAAYRSLFAEQHGHQSRTATQQIEITHAEQAYSHAWMLVNSRSFYWNYPRKTSVKNRRGKRRPRNDCLALCPFIDYFNHVADQDCAQVEYNVTGYTLRADRDYGVGEELNVSYGSHSNDFLLAEYGFVLQEPANVCDHASLDKYIVPRLTAVQRQALEEQDLLENYVLDRDGSVCYRTQCVVRAFLLPSTQLDRFFLGEDGGEREQEQVDAFIRDTLLRDFEQDIRDSQAYIEKHIASWEEQGWSYAAGMLKTRYQQLQSIVDAAKSRL